MPEAFNRNFLLSEFRQSNLFMKVFKHLQRDVKGSSRGSMKTLMIDQDIVLITMYHTTTGSNYLRL